MKKIDNTCKQQKKLLNVDIKTKLYVTKKIFDNDLVAKCKSKVYVKN